MTSLTPFDLATAGVLTVRGGSQDGMELELTDPVTRVGRGLQADLILENPTVSRRHAILVLRDGEVYLHDDNSLNGTWRNDERVRRRRRARGRRPAALRRGDAALRRVTARWTDGAEPNPSGLRMRR